MATPSDTEIDAALRAWLTSHPTDYGVGMLAAMRSALAAAYEVKERAIHQDIRHLEACIGDERAVSDEDHPAFTYKREETDRALHELKMSAGSYRLVPAPPKENGDG